MKSRDFWTSKPRKRHDGRQGEGCRGSKGNKKNVGSRWRVEVPEKVGDVEGRTKKWDFPHDQKAATEACCRIKISRALNEKARPSLDFAHKLAATCLVCLVAHKVSTATFKPIQLTQWVLSDPTTRPLKAPSSLIKRRERVSLSALQTYQMVHTAARVSRPDF